LKRINFAWVNIICMVILGVVIFINRVHRFYVPRSGVGYLLYALFVIAALLSIAGIIMTILNYYRAKKV
jgi:ABC-type siderophore export system fused ATPase/permease subunit